MAIRDHMHRKDFSRRVREAIAECDRYIAIEEPRSADLRPAEVAKLLADYKAHRANLIAALAEKEAVLAKARGQEQEV